MTAPLPDDDALWPGQCAKCLGYENADSPDLLCSCDDDLDADLFPPTQAEQDWQRLMERTRDWHDD